MNRNDLVAQKNKYILGFKQALKMAKSGKVELIVVAENCPEVQLKSIEATGVRTERFEGNSKDLGVVYGKPFNVTVVSFIK